MKKYSPTSPSRRQAEFIDYKKGSNFQTGDLKVKKVTTVRLPLFDFPGMEVRIDGVKINHWHDDCRNQPYCLGLITFQVPEGTHQIKAQLKETPVRLLSNIITVVSILLVFALLLKRYERKIS